MRATLPRAELLARLGLVKTVVGSAKTISILNHVRLVIAEGRVTLTGCDTIMRYTATLAATDTVPGATTVDARRFADLVGRFEAETIGLEAKDALAPLVITAGRARYTLPTLPATDFPEMRDPGADAGRLTIWPDAWTTLVDRTRASISTEETRIYLTGEYLYLHDGRLEAAATDGYRASIATAAAGHVEIDRAFDTIILPRATLAALQAFAKRSDEPMAATIDDDRVLFVRASESLLSMLTDATPADIRRIIPPRGDVEVVVSRAALAPALGRLRAMLPEKNAKRVEIRVAAVEPGSLRLGATNAGIGDGDEEVEATVAGLSGDQEMTVGLNIDYLAETVDAAPADEITLSMTLPSAPVRIFCAGNDDWVATILPRMN